MLLDEIDQRRTAQIEIRELRIHELDCPPWPITLLLQHNRIPFEGTCVREEICRGAALGVCLQRPSAYRAFCHDAGMRWVRVEESLDVDAHVAGCGVTPNVTVADHQDIEVVASNRRREAKYDRPCSGSTNCCRETVEMFGQ